MNTIEDVQAKVAAIRKQKFEESDQLSLGKLIEELEKVEKKDTRVGFDFGSTYPNDIDSWRGSYAELAFDYADVHPNFHGPDIIKNVSQIIQMLKDCIGKTFEGYKGGDFIMTVDTPLWVAHWGISGNTAVVGVRDEGWKVFILTAWREF